MPPFSAAAAPRAATRSPSPPATATNPPHSHGEVPLLQQAPISLLDQARALPELWFPRVLAQVNDHLLKVVRVAGEFPWHHHEHEDELFLVLEGTLLIGRSEADGGPLTLHAGQAFTVPRGVRHNTATPAGSEALLALLEPVSTLHTGAEHTPLTRSLADQMAARPGEPQTVPVP